MTTFKGSASSYGAGTIVNAIAAWKGSAFAIDMQTAAEVELLNESTEITGEILPDGGDTRLIEKCVALTLKYFDRNDYGCHVRTTSNIPLASGLKSSSAAANATVLAVADALGERIDRVEAARIGSRAALDIGISITGAFDDACASILGGFVVTDNREMHLLRHVIRGGTAVVLIPTEKAFTADTDIERSRLIAPYINNAFGLAMQGYFELAMTMNGFLYCAALGYDSNVLLRALEAGAGGVTLSGTGPAFVAIADENPGEVASAWEEFEGDVQTIGIIDSAVDSVGGAVDSLEALRECIGAIDEEIMGMLARRLELAEDVLNAKTRVGQVIIVESQIEAVLKRAGGIAREFGMDETAVRRLFENIIDITVQHETRTKERQ